MRCFGVSDVAPWRQGRGRRNIPEIDHGVTSGSPHGDQSPTVRARRTFAEKDNIRDCIFHTAEAAYSGARSPGRSFITTSPVSGGSPNSPGPRGFFGGCSEGCPSDEAEDFKLTVRKHLVQDHDIAVYDEAKWANIDAQWSGCGWKLEAMTDQGLCVCREGRCARTVAERFPMMGAQDLRLFGLRFAGKGTGPVASPARRQKASVSEESPTLCSPGMQADVPPVPIRRTKGTQLEDSPTLCSPGLHAALGVDGAKGGDRLSSARASPGDQRRRQVAGTRAHLHAYGMLDSGESSSAQPGLIPGQRRRQCSDAYRSSLHGGSLQR